MEFRIADTFTDSLARLTGDEQKAVKTTAFDLQLNPANPGMSFHKLDRAKDKAFWSVRVTRDVRIIVHKTAGSLMLCYVDHHDKAYDWAERRRLETHPKTGAAQLVEIRETAIVRDVAVPVYRHEPAPPAPKPALFSSVAEHELSGYGVPEEWLPAVRAATEDTILEVAGHLPAEAAEALLQLATGGTPPAPAPVVANTSPFDHPDAQRRFRIVSNVEELARALDYPWDKWTVFLHPDQRQLVERDYAGPARVSGSAGTGKTIVALHRAVHVARKNANARVLLTTVSEPLANALHTKLRRLIGNEPRLADRIDVASIDSVGERLGKAHLGKVTFADRAAIRGAIEHASGKVGAHKFGIHFLLTEWDEVVDAWQLATWEAYRDVARLGRKTRLQEPQRKLLWSIFDQATATLKERGLTTRAAMFTDLAAVIAALPQPPFDHVVVDEAQDVGIAHLRFLAALGAGRKNGLFFAGDLGQRIFQQPFSWKALGVDVRGRARSLRVNYRTSHQIRTQADRLLGAELSDVDGNREARSGTISVFNGLPPRVQVVGDPETEIEAVGGWLREIADSGILPHEIGVFVRSAEQLERASAAVARAKLDGKVLDEHVDVSSGRVAIGTMHLAKGLEFRAVVVMACDDEVIPLQSRIASVGDDADLQETYDTERQLLYVACTRARDRLLVTGVEPASEFLDDLLASEGDAK